MLKNRCRGSLRQRNKAKALNLQRRWPIKAAKARYPNAGVNRRAIVYAKPALSRPGNFSPVCLAHSCTSPSFLQSNAIGGRVSGGTGTACCLLYDKKKTGAKGERV